MQPGKGLGEALRLGIEDEVDVALAVEGDVLRAVARRRDEPHALEQRGEGLRVGPRVLDEFEPVRPHRVVPQIAPSPLRRTHWNLQPGPPPSMMWSPPRRSPRTAVVLGLRSASVSATERAGRRGGGRRWQKW